MLVLWACHGGGGGERAKFNDYHCFQTGECRRFCPLLRAYKSNISESRWIVNHYVTYLLPHLSYVSCIWTMYNNWHIHITGCKGIRHAACYVPLYIESEILRKTYTSSLFLIALKEINAMCIPGFAPSGWTLLWSLSLWNARVSVKNPQTCKIPVVNSVKCSRCFLSYRY